MTTFSEKQNKNKCMVDNYLHLKSMVKEFNTQKNTISYDHLCLHIEGTDQI